MMFESSMYPTEDGRHVLLLKPREGDERLVNESLGDIRKETENGLRIEPNQLIVGLTADYEKFLTRDKAFEGPGTLPSGESIVSRQQIEGLLGRSIEPGLDSMSAPAIDRAAEQTMAYDHNNDIDR